MSDRIRVGLLFGGKSAEHRVSVVSARGVAAGFDPAQIECVPVAVTRKGRWLPPQASREILESRRDEVPEPDDSAGGIAALPGGGGLWMVRPGSTPQPLALDAVFPVIHGWGGEDGRVQALLDLSGVPCVGSGVAGSAVAMDKGLARSVLHGEGVPMAPWVLLTAGEIRERGAALAPELEEFPGFPLFVKPANGGSSLGISRVADPEGLEAALETALSLDRRVVVERAVDAREIECAVLGNRRPEASMPGEIVPAAEFYTYEDKYVDGAAQLLIPARIEPAAAREVRELALRVYRSLDLAGMARIDFLMDRSTGELYFNEANTIPGFTPISMYAKLWEAGGLAYPSLLSRLVELALEQQH